MKLTKRHVISAAHAAIKKDPTLTKQQFIQKFICENEPQLTRWTISTYVSNLPFFNTKNKLAKAQHGANQIWEWGYETARYGRLFHTLLANARKSCMINTTN